MGAPPRVAIYRQVAGTSTTGPLLMPRSAKVVSFDFGAA
jgi:hypothetical protein